MSTPREVLASLMQRSTGRALEQVSRIVDGYENEVYLLRAAHGVGAVVRIRRFGGKQTLAGATAEAEAITGARQVGVPGPEVLLVDLIEIAGAEFPVMVQREVPGRPLRDVWATLDAGQRTGVAVEVGELIAKLNRVPAPGDWAARTSAEVEHRLADRDLVLSAGFTPAEADAMFLALESYVEAFPCPHPVLCHGDLSPSHLYLDASGRISGVIDFGDAGAGSSVHDLAVLRVRAPALDVEAVLSGYRPPTTPDFRRQLDLDTLLVALFSVKIGVEEGDDACVARVSPLIRRLLADMPDSN